MKRFVYAVALSLALLAIAACSRKGGNDPLAFAPANTPYAIASLKPLDEATQDALLTRANAQLPAQVTTMRSLADRMDTENKKDAAGLLRAFADELDGQTVQQFADRVGLAMRGHSVVFGLGLSPVARFELKDPAKFNAFIGRLEKGYGHDFKTASLGKVSYRYADLGKAPLKFILAVEKRQAVVALLPADAGKSMLGEALGTERPKQSLLDSGRLKKLADERGYQPYAVGFIDMTKLPALLVDAKDPLLQALRKAEGADSRPWPLGADCKADLERITSRMPLMSFGYTRLEPKHMDQRVDLDMAPDITKAFSGLKVDVPGLGGGLDAPFDMALAVPVKSLREFLSAQADAVAAKPFTCPAFAGMNQGFAKLRAQLPKLAMPGIGDLLGLRLSLDSIKPAGMGGRPSATGRVVIASNNPAGLFALMQSMASPLSSLDVKPDGKPVAVPPQLARMVQQPAWIAMSSKALAVGVGNGEDAKLASMLKAASGEAGDLMRMRLDGAMYVRWLTAILDRADSAIDRQAASDDPKVAAEAEKARKQMQQSRAAALDAAKRIDSISAHLHMGSKGLVIESQATMH